MPSALQPVIPSNEQRKYKLNIVNVQFPDNQYFKEEYNKTQITLHHTVSGPPARGDINYWLSTADRIATAYIVDRDGTVYQCFEPKYWGYHLGVRTADANAVGITYKRLDMTNIGIEIDSWGGLVKHTDNKWYPAYWDNNLKKNIPYLKAGAVANVVEYPKGFRGYFAFEKYTTAQINATTELMSRLATAYNIPTTYNDNIWNINKNALTGVPGIYSHVSFRTDKSDAHPDSELITALKTL